MVKDKGYGSQLIRIILVITPCNVIKLLIVITFLFSQDFLHEVVVVMEEGEFPEVDREDSEVDLVVGIEVDSEVVGEEVEVDSVVDAVVAVEAVVVSSISVEPTRRLTY